MAKKPHDAILPALLPHRLQVNMHVSGPSVEPALSSHYEEFDMHKKTGSIFKAITAATLMTGAMTAQAAWELDGAASSFYYVTSRCSIRGQFVHRFEWRNLRQRRSKPRYQPGKR